MDRIPLWLLILTSVVGALLGILFLFLWWVYTKKYKETKANFEAKYANLSPREKSGVSKDEFWVTNYSLWIRSRHILFPLLALTCFTLSVSFALGQPLGMGI